MPWSSRDAVHDRSTLVGPAAVAVRPEGAVGGPVSTTAPVSSTSEGSLDPSREPKSIPSVDVPARAKLYVPLPVTSAVTFHSTHAPLAIAALSSCGSPVLAGRLPQLIPVSVQALDAAKTAGPLPVELEAKSRSL